MELVPMKDCPGWFECLGCGGRWNVESSLCPACVCSRKEPEESICHEADRLVSTERGTNYGHPVDDFGKVVAMAHALWGRGPETEEEHAIYMILVKLSREVNKPKRDNRVDIAGYAKTLDMIHERRRQSDGDSFA